MKVLTEGHRYELRDFESCEVNNVDVFGHQTLQFIQKVPIQPGTTDLETVANGTTNEEVLAMLIDRLSYLQAKFPCRENAIVITKLEESLMWLNERTRKRQSRGVEGKQIA